MHPTQHISATIFGTVVFWKTYERSDQRRRLMPLYTRRIIEHSRYHRQPTKSTEQRPECPEYIANILSTLFPIAQEPRYGSRQFVQR
jgi:hypothetical protein